MPRHDDDGDEDDNDDGDEDLDVNVEALAGRALRGLCGELALLKEEGEEGEEGVLVDLPLVSLKLGLGDEGDDDDDIDGDYGEDDCHDGDYGEGDDNGELKRYRVLLALEAFSV